MTESRGVDEILHKRGVRALSEWDREKRSRLNFQWGMYPWMRILQNTVSNN